jgi:hypothetical protein
VEALAAPDRIVITMRHFKSKKGLRKEILSGIFAILFLFLIMAIGLFQDGSPDYEKILFFSTLTVALGIVFGIYIWRDFKSNKGRYLRVENGNLISSSNGIESKIDLKTISKIVTGIRKDKVIFIRIKHPDLSWMTVDKYENLEELSGMIIENSQNAKVKIKKKGFISLSKY